MANERKTETIVRRHFEKYLDDIFIEEQSSDHPKIKKLLASASKSGKGAGYPEFLIRLKNNPDLLIVIECKADIKKHATENKDNYRDYAVDGSLLYSSYLSREFDVLSIGISGENKKELKVTHHLQLNKSEKVVEVFGGELLTIDDYFNGYIKSPIKFRQDYDKLLEFSKKLNEKLHLEKIVESDRGLLISSILIALENTAFDKSFKDYHEPKQLAEYLVNTVKNEFESSKIGDEKTKTLMSRFAFIKTDTSLSRKNNVLMNVIADIKENIKDFIKTHRYYDVLGQLYIEFLRYANSDKGLGIVLTPPHITEFMCQLAEVNKDSRVYDNCTGTGGFLVSAMSQMIDDADGDTAKIDSIKKSQLIGVEYQAHIFALACSNMFIHQDGKSNILHGSCFDEDIIRLVKEKKPTVGLLNPPYKSDKKNDIDEYEFILNNLECLEQGGKCVAIVPQSLGLKKSGKVFELKKRLLEKHTLEAVFSMPDELFFNSKVSTITSIIVFTAKRPHPENKTTYFGYYKDDGFIKRKTQGRVDLDQVFEKDISKKWITSYINKERIPGFSVNKVVTASDEWSPEPYMETNYKTFSKELVEKKILNYSTYLFSNKYKDTVSSSSVYTKDVELNTANWQYHKLTDLFDVVSTRDDLINDLTVGGNTPYITSSDSNNGVTNLIRESSDFGENTITANRGGSVGYFFYQPHNYMATPVDVRVLVPKFDLNPYLAMFFITIFEMEKYRYNYSRKMGTDRLKTFNIKLPSSNKKPDFEKIEAFVKSLKYSSNLL